MPKPEGHVEYQIQIAMEWSSIMIFNTVNQYNAAQVHVCPSAAILKIQATYKIILSLSQDEPSHLFSLLPAKEPSKRKCNFSLYIFLFLHTAPSHEKSVWTLITSNEFSIFLHEVNKPHSLTLSLSLSSSSTICEGADRAAGYRHTERDAHPVSIQPLEPTGKEKEKTDSQSPLHLWYYSLHSLLLLLGKWKRPSLSFPGTMGNIDTGVSRQYLYNGGSLFWLRLVC